MWLFLRVLKYFLPGTLQATRALMVIGILLGLIAIFVATIGMKCMKCLEDDEVQKMRMAVIGGVIFLISGKRGPGPPPLSKLSLEWCEIQLYISLDGAGFLAVELIYFSPFKIWRHGNLKSSWLSHSQRGRTWKFEICAHRQWTGLFFEVSGANWFISTSFARWGKIPSI